MKRYDLLLFDADGTLFDFDRACVEALCATFDRYGVELGEEGIALYREANDACWEEFERGEISRDELKTKRFRVAAERMGVEIDDYDEFNDYYLRALGEGDYLLPYAEEVVTSLAPHFDMAIVTNGLKVSQARRFEKSPLTKYFRHIFISEEIGVQKPQIEFFDHVFSVIGVVDRSRTIIIGDSAAADMQGGTNAGIATCYVNPTGKAAGDGVRIDYEVRDLREIVPILMEEV